MKYKKTVIILVGIVLVAGLFLVHTASQARAHQTAIATEKAEKAKKVEKAKQAAKRSVMRKPINWRKSSETVAYPEVSHYPDLWIHVSLEKQRMYLMTKHRVLYTMYASTGVQTADRKTPRGTYHVQRERGKYFYSASVSEGAYYWVSWLNHGEYLFHSTPVDAQGHYIKSDAADLGKKPSSHGCVHLSVADSKWVYENIRYGTKVVID